VAATLRAWGLPPEIDQGRVAVRMERLARQIDQLTTRVQELEEQLAARGETPETGE
jgi:chaperonin cofactor prefoldin